MYANKYENLENLRANIGEFIEGYYNPSDCTRLWVTDPPRNSSNIASEKVW
jgi:hypothetical protein